MSELRQYFMTIALSLEIESRTYLQLIGQHDLMKHSQILHYLLLLQFQCDSEYKVCAVTFL